MTHHCDPYLDAGMRGWLLNISKKNQGRIANFDFDDLVQEGYLCFYKCRARYVGKQGLKKRDGTLCQYLPPDNPSDEARKHFMCLVKTTFNNRISDLALKQPAGWETAISSSVGENQTIEAAWEKLIPPEQEVADVSMLLKNAPWEISMVLRILIGDVFVLHDSCQKRCRKIRIGGRKQTIVSRETNNERFCRLLGLPQGTDIVGQVEGYFLR
jgi:hypothetical protein